MLDIPVSLDVQTTLLFKQIFFFLENFIKLQGPVEKLALGQGFI